MIEGALTGYTTQLVDVLHNILAARLDICDEGCTVGDILEVIDGKFNSYGVCDGDEM